MAFPFAQFPPHVVCAVSYGSAFFKQHGKKAGEMHDYVLVVRDEDLPAFHRVNMKRHPMHYSLLARILGPDAVCHVQRWLRPKVYYNPFVTLRGDLLCKYGVASLGDLQQDLASWDSLYLAGRLHKPVVLQWPVRQPQQPIEDAHESDSEAPAQEDVRPLLTEELRANRLAALRAALLLLPGEFSFGQLLATVCRLSYAGDPRMGLAEDAGKVESIMAGQAAELFAVYMPLLLTLQRTAAAQLTQQPLPTQEGSPAVDAPPAPLLEVAAPMGGEELARWAALGEAFDGRLLGGELGAAPPKEMGVEEVLGQELKVKQAASNDAFRQHLFEGLPPALRFRANALSASRRFNAIFSPLSLLKPPDAARVLGRPLPHDAEVLRDSLKWLVRRSATPAIAKGLFSAGPLKSALYTAKKVAKRLKL